MEWLVLIPLAGCVASVWFAICSRMAFSSRITTIRSWNTDSPTYDADINRFMSVTRNQHLWALFFFRDPMNLYEVK